MPCLILINIYIYNEINNPLDRWYSDVDSQCLGNCDETCFKNLTSKHILL